MNAGVEGRIGRYEIVEQLGQGGMGVVYRARDTVLERSVVLKRLRQPLEATQEAFRRFLQEAKAAAGLHHPNIVVIHDYEPRSESGPPFIVMEYLPGGSLRGWLQGRPAPGLEQRLDVALQVADGLHYAHQCAVVHCDVKPSNVMVLPSGLAKLVDFGLAQIGKPEAASGDTIAGSPQYMAPELFHGQAPTPVSDVFSFGVLLYEVLTGRRPFAGETLEQAIGSILFAEPAPFAAQDEALPASLRALVLGCLIKDPQRRVSSLVPVLDELRRHPRTRSPGGARQPAAPAAPAAGDETQALAHAGAGDETQLLEPAAPLELVFRPPSAGAPEPPGPHEVYLRARDPSAAERREMAWLVFEGGLEALERGPGAPRRVVVPSDPTLDDLLAAELLRRRIAQQRLPPGAGAFARYAALAREGLQPGSVPLEASMEGIFLAVRNAAGADLSEPAAAARFTAAWSRMARVLLEAADAGVDPFTTPLFAAGADFARERAFLARDRDVYRQDVLRGERWLVRLPGDSTQSSGLLLRNPRSLLFKYWSRGDPQAPAGGTYLFLAVLWGRAEWVFSTDPILRLPIRALAERLQAAEAARDPQRAAANPWFDGAPFGHTLVGAPRGGTRLDEAEVLRLVQTWADARPVA